VNGIRIANHVVEEAMPKDTSEYSPSKAPETQQHAEERDEFADPRLIPGGAEPRTHSAQGMAGLDRDALPSEAQNRAEAPQVGKEKRDR
jgi:hypothetical protein